MKRIFTFFWAFFISIIASKSQNAIVGDGFSSGWGTACSNANNYKYLSAGVGSTYGVTTTASGTGDRFFRLGIDWSGTFAQRTLTVGSDITVSPGTKYTLNSTCTSSGSMVYNVSSTAFNYIFKTLNAGTNPTGTFVFFEVQGAVSSATAQSRNPSGTVNGGQSVDITATLSSSLNIGQAAFLRYTTDGFSTSTVLKMSGSGTTYTATIPGVGTNTTVTYYIFTSGDVSSIAPADADLFTINLLNNGGSNYSYTTSAVLDVALINLSVDKSNSLNKLIWQTSSEKNTAQFNIQRSTNNQTWQTIGSVKATNNPTGSKYSFVDEAPLSTVNYYRLQMVDNDGKMTYSKVVAVGNDGKQTLSVYPNPTKSELNLVTDGNTEGVSIFDMTGRTVLQVRGQQTKVNVSDLTSGVYFIRLLDNKGVLSTPVRFVKQ